MHADAAWRLHEVDRFRVGLGFEGSDVVEDKGHGCLALIIFLRLRLTLNPPDAQLQGRHQLAAGLLRCQPVMVGSWAWVLQALPVRPCLSGRHRWVASRVDADALPLS